MSPMIDYIIATFTSPENIGTNPQSLLWLLPLAAAISIGYKATKLSEIKAGSFIKDIVGLFGSIVVFMAITALVLYAITWFATE
jgi:hypothetical protein